MKILQTRRTVATLPPTILLKTSWNEVSREAFARTGAIKTNTNIEALWLLLKGLSWHLYIRRKELRLLFLFAVLHFFFNLEFVILQKASLDTSQYQEQGDDGKSCDFPSCLQCSNFSFYEFVILQKTSHDTSQYQEALARWPRKSFSCLTVTCLVAQIPPAKTFQMPWTLCNV